MVNQDYRPGSKKFKFNLTLISESPFNHHLKKIYIYISSYWAFIVFLFILSNKIVLYQRLKRYDFDSNQNSKLNIKVYLYYNSEITCYKRQL